jgi:hypothetical protein
MVRLCPRSKTLTRRDREAEAERLEVTGSGLVLRQCVIARPKRRQWSAGRRQNPDLGLTLLLCSKLRVNSAIPMPRNVLYNALNPDARGYTIFEKPNGGPLWKKLRF